MYKDKVNSGEKLKENDFKKVMRKIRLPQVIRH